MSVFNIINKRTDRGYCCKKKNDMETKQKLIKIGTITTSPGPGVVKICPLPYAIFQPKRFIITLRIKKKHETAVFSGCL